jgi:tRNA/tmRNA/rRNA uracil-C5-methylase (TrmA/RlmC/RlmD family)
MAGGTPCFGLYRAGSHDVIPVPDCAAHHPSINDALRRFHSALLAAGTVPYDEVSRAGDLRFVQCSTLGSAPDAAVELSLVWAQPLDCARLLALRDALLREFAAGSAVKLASLHAHSNSRRGNAALDPSGPWTLLHGDEGFHWERFGGADVAFHPGAFLQANYEAFDALLHRMGDMLRPRLPPGGLAVCEMYAGCGAIGLSLLRSGAAATLTAVELSPAAAAPFAASAAHMRLGTRARLLVASAGEAAALDALHASGAELLLVDPPRKGLDAGLLEELCAPPSARSPHLLAYVSCGFAALQRDAALLYAAGWRLAAAPAAFLFFPGTDSLETLVLFRRERPPEKGRAD